MRKKKTHHFNFVLQGNQHTSLHCILGSKRVHGEPLRWDEVRRAQLHAELDAYYARLYGLTRDKLRYTPYDIDPKEVNGEDFPSETFRVLKEKEVRLYGDASH